MDHRTDGFLRIANGTFKVARELFDCAFGLHFLIADRLADHFLDRTFRLIDGALDLILVHFANSWVRGNCQRTVRDGTKSVDHRHLLDTSCLRLALQLRSTNVLEETGRESRLQWCQLCRRRYTCSHCAFRTTDIRSDRK